MRVGVEQLRTGRPAGTGDVDGEAADRQLEPRLGDERPAPAVSVDVSFVLERLYRRPRVIRLTPNRSPSTRSDGAGLWGSSSPASIWARTAAAICS